MIILHGALLEDALFLWGEEPADETGGRRGGRKQRIYPYDAGAEAVSRAARELPISFRPTARRRQRVTAWLPTRGSHPLPSSALIGEPPTTDGEVSSEPWLVEGIPLGTGEALNLLSAYGQRAGSHHGLVGGRDLNFWLRALRLAGSMVARQRYLPGVEVNGKVSARWEPVWITDDLRYLEELARAMPASARALVPEGGEAPREAPLALLERFVGSLVDHIVRFHSEPVDEDGMASSMGASLIADDRPDATVHDRWLGALRAESPQLKARNGDAADLADQIREWRQPLDVVVGAPFRLCFRLEEPAPPKEESRPGGKRRGRRGGKVAHRDQARPGQRRWYVRYLLQGTEDPSLIVPTADAWILRGRKALALQKSGYDVHHTLLISLAQAAGVCPKIEMSLRSRKPSGYSLDARGAHEFLTQTAPALEQAGFGTILPDWWTGHGTRDHLAVRARVHTPETCELEEEPSLDDFVKFDWEICLAGKSLSHRDLEELARLKEPLQRVRGHWVMTSVEEIHAALEFYKNRKGGEVTAREIVRMALGAADTSAGIHFEGVRATGWLGSLLERLVDKESLDPLSTEEDFRGELRPYQEHGFAWLAFLRRWELGACLADDMGLGKTIQTLALIQRERRRGEDRPVLLVCPTSVLANWEREAARFTPDLATLIHHGPQRVKGYEFVRSAHEHAIVLTSYALVHRDLEDLRSMRWAGVIVDEAQNIKNPDTKQSKAVRALVADYRAALTGTPVENHVGDLWSIMDFLNPEFLGTREQFKREFLVPIQAHRDPDAIEKLSHITRPFILRRLKTDSRIISDLPEKLEMKVFCALTSEQGDLYERVVDEAERQDPRRRGDRATRRHPGDTLQAQAGLQPPGALPGRRQRAGPALGQAHPAHRDARRGHRGRRPGARLHPVCRDGQAPAEAPAGSAGPRDLLPARRHAEEAARSDGRALPSGGRRAPRLRALAQGGRHRPQPDRRQPRLPLRPLVEPGGGEPGHRPGLPHRADAERAGAQVRVRGHAGGAHRRDDRAQEVHRRRHRGHGRTVDHGAVGRRAPRSVLAAPRRRQGLANRMSDEDNGSSGTGDEGSSEERRTRRRRPRRRSKPRAGDSERAGGERAEAQGRSRPNRGGGRRNRNKRNPRGRPRRGRGAENWWARRWVQVLEKLAVGRRLDRGRHYARQGNIVDIEIGKGFVTAHVQGSRDAPYLVRMHFSMLSSTDWKKITRALIAREEIAVELGMGQIPESIEGVFEEQELSLFPSASGDLKAACSCPDNANPCKHVAAVYYLLGEEFDRDPFLIFQLRGMERQELLAALGPAAIPKPPAPPPPPEWNGEGELADGEEGEWLDAPPPIPELQPPPEREIPDEPLPADAELFWSGAVPTRDEQIEVRIPRTPGAVAARLGGFPFWRGVSNCEAEMARIYRNASIAGLDVYLGAGEVDEVDDG